MRRGSRAVFLELTVRELDGDSEPALSAPSGVSPRSIACDLTPGSWSCLVHTMCDS